MSGTFKGFPDDRKQRQPLFKSKGSSTKPKQLKSNTTGDTSVGKGSEVDAAYPLCTLSRCYVYVCMNIFMCICIYIYPV